MNKKTEKHMINFNLIIYFSEKHINITEVIKRRVFK